MLNPYKPGSPIRELHLFFGRQKTMRTILDGLQGVHFAVYSPRHIGKTSLLYHLAETSPALHLNFQTETGDPVKLASRVREPEPAGGTGSQTWHGRADGPAQRDRIVSEKPLPGLKQSWGR
jgi:hypothetical protein